jgi:hypothetical protein
MEKMRFDNAAVLYFSRSSALRPPRPAERNVNNQGRVFYRAACSIDPKVGGTKSGRSICRPYNCGERELYPFPRNKAYSGRRLRKIAGSLESFQPTSGEQFFMGV